MRRIIGLIIGVVIISGVIVNLFAEEKYTETYVPEKIIEKFSTYGGYDVNNKGDKIMVSNNSREKGYYIDLFENGRKTLEISCNKYLNESVSGYKGVFFDEEDNIYYYEIGLFKKPDIIHLLEFDIKGNFIKEYFIPKNTEMYMIKYEAGRIYDQDNQFIAWIKENKSLYENKVNSKEIKFDFSTGYSYSKEVKENKIRKKISGLKMLGAKEDEKIFEYTIPKFTDKLRPKERTCSSIYVLGVDDKNNIYIYIGAITHIGFGGKFHKYYCEINKLNRDVRVMAVLKFVDDFVEEVPSPYDFRVDKNGNIYQRASGTIIKWSVKK